MATVEFGVTFGKKNFRISLGKERTLGDLRQEIFKITGVEPSQQKLMGLIPAGKNIREISDDTPLGNGLVKGQTWKKPRQKIIVFGVPEKELVKQMDEEQKAIEKTQALREQFDAIDAYDEMLEEKSKKREIAIEREREKLYLSEFERSVKKVREFEENLTSGFLGVSLPGFGNDTFTPTYTTPQTTVPPLLHESETGSNMDYEEDNNNDENNSRISISNSGSDLSAKISTSLYMYSSVMSEDQSGLLDISAKSKY